MTGQMKNINQIVKERLKKLDELTSLNIKPYANRFERTTSIKELIGDFREGRDVTIAGRITALRAHGKSIFGDIRDENARIQLYVKKDEVGEEKFDIFCRLIDIGDFVGVKGQLFKTRTGEITLKISDFELLAKSLRPLPEKWHGLKDVEARYRQRYLDLISNENAKKVFVARSKVIAHIREFLNSRGYLEVETPMMHDIPGGAAGKPFKTHHEALNIDLYLRIAPELYLKKLLVGGFERVYELNKSFRNEGISTRHNPEFTMLEVYTAYYNMKDVMRLTQELINYVAKKIVGKLHFEYNGIEIDLSKWETISFADMMKEKFDIIPEDDVGTWLAKLRKKNIKIDGMRLSRMQIVNIVADILEPDVKKHPVFIVDYFTELCPLAKTKAKDPNITERFELFLGGMEVANAYSELNDPIEQRRRFEKELADKENSEVKRIDEDFLRALEYGMPPAGGLGIGIDRLVMLLTNQSSIREVILFPQMRPEK